MGGHRGTRFRRPFRHTGGRRDEWSTSEGDPGEEHPSPSLPWGGHRGTRFRRPFRHTGGRRDEWSTSEGGRIRMGRGNRPRGGKEFTVCVRVWVSSEGGDAR